MSNIKLSKQHAEELLWYNNIAMNDEYGKKEAYIENVCLYIERVRRASRHKQYHRAPAQKRIDRLIKAFDALTAEDKDLIDRRIDGHISHIDCDNNEMIPSCDNMIQAIKEPVPSDRKSYSRWYLLHFAHRAIYFDWVDVSTGSTDLAEVLQIIMKEAGVKHDAVDITLEAMSERKYQYDYETKQSAIRQEKNL